MVNGEGEGTKEKDNNNEEGDDSTQAPLPPKSPKRKALKKSIPAKVGKRGWGVGVKEDD